MHLRDLIEAGHYQQAIEKIEKKTVLRPVHKADYIVALSFMNRLKEARVHFEQHQKSFSGEQKSRVRFFLVINLSRNHMWSLANEHLEALQKEPCRKKAAKTFYTAQANAFYQLYRSRFQKALDYSEESFAIAVSEKKVYWKVLSADLMAHSLQGLGKIRNALNYFEIAKKSCLQKKYDNLARAINVSILLCRSKNGFVHLNTAIAEISKQIKESLGIDSYSVPNLMLELARIYILKGEYELAGQELEKIFKLIYSYNNQRHDCLFKLRRAELNFQRGRYQQALENLLDAKRWPELQSNKALQAHVTGMEYKVLRKLDLCSQAVALEDKLRELKKATPSASNKTITNRLLGVSEKSLLQGDRVHNFFDFISKDVDLKEKLNRCVDEGLLCFLPDLLEVDRRKMNIVFGLQSESMTLISPSGIRHIPRVDSELMYKLFKALSSGLRKREDLFYFVWGQEYHSLRHSHLLYNLVAKCRKKIAPHEDWLETLEEGYAFRSEVFIHLFNKPEETKKSSFFSKKKDAGESALPDSLNFRQRKSLEKFSEKMFFSIKDYCQFHSVSRNTATRDLNELINLNFVKSSGKGPSRRFTLS